MTVDPAHAGTVGGNEKWLKVERIFSAPITIIFFNQKPNELTFCFKLSA